MDGNVLSMMALVVAVLALANKFIAPVNSFPMQKEEAYHDENVPGCGVLNYEQGMEHPRVIVVNGVRYNVLGQIQHGATSKVFHVFKIDESGQKQCMAVKQVDWGNIERQQQNQVDNEVELLSELNAKGIERIPLLYTKERHPASQQISMVFELAHHDLFDEITSNMGKGKYGWTRETLREILRAMLPVHKNGIVHGDIKPENMAYFLGTNGDSNQQQQPVLKVIDFGGAMRANNLDSACRDIITGTIMYMSPEQVAWCAAHGDEQFLARQNDFKLSTKSDVWSIGIILYQMLFGHNPYRWLMQKFDDLAEPDRSEKVDDELRTVILNGERPFEFNVDYQDKQIVDMLRKCLNRDPRQRPEVDELLEQLEKLDDLDKKLAEAEKNLQNMGIAEDGEEEEQMAQEEEEKKEEEEQEEMPFQGMLIGEQLEQMAEEKEEEK